MAAIGEKEKKQLGILGGVLLLLVLVVVFVIKPFGGGENSSAPPVASATDTSKAIAGKGANTDDPNTKAPAGPGSPAAAGAPAPGGAPAGDAAPAVGGAAAAAQVNAIRVRDDPFQPFYTVPILPTPTPVPLPPLNLEPPPSRIVLPAVATVAASVPRETILDLPTAKIKIRPSSTSGVAFPPARNVVDSGVIPRSGNKRLSGVIIGDSVRALLEISTPDEVITRVVQPGDEVDGIRVLNIERFVEGGKTITRMYVMEDNRESYVDLRPAPQQSTTGAEGGGGAPRPGGRPGGLP